MIKSALKHHASRVEEQETSTVLDALKKLEKLSSTRNQIAHGHVSQINKIVENHVAMRGFFLSSRVDPMGIFVSRELNIKYAHTAAEIDEWRDKVRHERGKIMDVCMAIFNRDQGYESDLEA